MFAFPLHSLAFANAFKRLRRMALFERLLNLRALLLFCSPILSYSLAASLAVLFSSYFDSPDKCLY